MQVMARDGKQDMLSSINLGNSCFNKKNLEKRETISNSISRAIPTINVDGCEHLTFPLLRTRAKKVDTKNLISMNKESTVRGRLILEV